MESKDIGITHFVCPRCQQRAVRMPHTGDFQHDCFGSETLANEDVLVIGDWQDYTGSDTNVSPTQLQFAGTVNTLQGTRAGLEGAKNYPRTSRGFNATTHRTRRHIEQINDSAFTSMGIPDTEPITSDKP